MIGMTEAAKRTGLKRQTIHKAIREGRISAKKNESKQWEIDPVELFRVYPPVSTVDVNKNEKVDAGLQNVDSGLQREIDLLHERLTEKDQIIDDLREDRDQWRRQATALLTDQREKPAPLSSPLPLQPSPKPPLSSTSTLTTWLTVLFIMTVSVALFFWLRFS
jgi:hypothetical protein